MQKYGAKVKNVVFVPEDGAHPTISEVGELEAVAEEEIGALYDRDVPDNVIRTIHIVHPYKEALIEITALENF